MRRPEVKANNKSRRKPFKDVTSDNVRRSSKSINPKISFLENKDKERNAKLENDDNVLDRLLLGYNLISPVSFIRLACDGLMNLFVQVFNSSASSKGRQEIDYFTHVLSNMLSSLKSWIPRFQEVLATPLVERDKQPIQTLADKTVSPAIEVET